MTDSEIVKALECCVGDDDGKNCFDCPLWEIDDCQEQLLLDVLDLINRIQAENEQWKEEANRYQNLWCKAVGDIETAKAEAYKEFAERLKTHTRKMQSSDFSGDFWDKAVLVSDIDNLLKEMVDDE